MERWKWWWKILRALVSLFEMKIRKKRLNGVSFNAFIEKFILNFRFNVPENKRDYEPTIVCKSLFIALLLRRWIIYLIKIILVHHKWTAIMFQKNIFKAFPTKISQWKFKNSVPWSQHHLNIDYFGNNVQIFTFHQTQFAIWCDFHLSIIKHALFFHQLI